MMVDDEKEILEVFRKGLELKECEVDAFTDPIEALKQFKPYRYDVVFTDVRMPGLNGLDLYRLIRKQDDKVKVYFVSAIEVDVTQIKAEFPDLALGSLISKPVSIDKLFNLVEG